LLTRPVEVGWSRALSGRIGRKQRIEDVVKYTTACAGIRRLLSGRQQQSPILVSLGRAAGLAGTMQRQNVGLARYCIGRFRHGKRV
jgi:hypothetical protein